MNKPMTFAECWKRLCELHPGRERLISLNVEVLRSRHGVNIVWEFYDAARPVGDALVEAPTAEILIALIDQADVGQQVDAVGTVNDDEMISKVVS